MGAVSTAARKKEAPHPKQTSPATIPSSHHPPSIPRRWHFIVFALSQLASQLAISHQVKIPKELIVLITRLFIHCLNRKGTIDYKNLSCTLQINNINLICLQGIVVNSKGDIIIAEARKPSKTHICVYNSKGKSRAVYRYKMIVTDIAIDDNDNVYLLTQEKILITNPRGEIVQEFPIREANSKFSICLTENGEILFSDGLGIWYYYPSGEELIIWTSMNEILRRKPFNGRFCLGGPDSELHIIDGRNFVLVCSTYGNVRRFIAEATSPKYINCDDSGTIFMDHGCGYQIFSPDGRFLGTIGAGGSGLGEFETPGPIFFRDGIIYIVDISLQRVQVFSSQARGPDCKLYKLPFTPPSNQMKS